MIKLILLGVIFGSSNYPTDQEIQNMTCDAIYDIQVKTCYVQYRGKQLQRCLEGNIEQRTECVQEEESCSCEPEKIN